MNYVIAVSGGVDSVVLLDMLARKRLNNAIVVAHFDHGIREDSADDAVFVKHLAAKYGYAFETLREELGDGASEEVARTRRYAFLRSLAEKHSAKIVTAHHADDAVETIAINFTRGTGWRGLAVLDSDIVRPLLHKTKAELLDYALTQQLEWHEDSTNASDVYLRNRVRQNTHKLSADHKKQLLALRTQQMQTKRDIEKQIIKLVGTGPEYSRYFFAHAPVVVAVECLRWLTNAKLTRPQLERALLAIKTAQPKSVYEAGSGVSLYFSTRNFSFSLLK